MTKTPILWITAAALLGLSACTYDSSTGDCLDDAAPKCTADGKLEICKDNAWVKTDCKGTTPICLTDKCVACANDSKRCEKNAVEHCVENAWTQKLACGDKVCNPTTYVCDAAPCKAGSQRCSGKSLERCNTDLKYTESEQCAAYCLENSDAHTANCIECAVDKPCLDDKKRCDTITNRCLAPSSITWCWSMDFETKTKLATGRVLDSRTPKDQASITANYLCGKTGQKLSEYKVMTGTFKKAQDDYFQYEADFSALASGQYLCMWSFALDGEEAVACETVNAANVVSDFSTVPKANEAHKPIIAWDHLVDFESFKASSLDNNTETITKNDIETSIIGAIHGNGDGSIDKNTLVFADNTTGSVTIKILAENDYIEHLSFEYKRWDHQGFVDGQKLRLYINEDVEPTFTLPLSGATDTTQTVSIPIKQNVKSFKIENKGIGTKPFPRLLLDNINWTNHK